jgi:hypothetical protein
MDAGNRSNRFSGEVGGGADMGLRPGPDSDSYSTTHVVEIGGI